MVRSGFSPGQLGQVQHAEWRAFDLVRRFYLLAPREILELRYQVRTLRDLEPDEIAPGALAQLMCYEVTRHREDEPPSTRDLYCICLQDHRILARAAELPLEALLLYVFTHELVHVVRFGTGLQRIDLPNTQRPREEAAVDRTARRILRLSRTPRLGDVLARFEHYHDPAWAYPCFQGPQDACTQP